MVKFFHPPYAIYILVIGPHFFQVVSPTFALSSNFTPCCVVLPCVIHLFMLVDELVCSFEATEIEYFPSFSFS